MNPKFSKQLSDINRIEVMHFLQETIRLIEEKAGHRDHKSCKRKTVDTD